MQGDFVRVPDVPTAAFGDELAVMNLQSGSYIAFNRTAAEIWGMLEEPRSLDSLVEELSERYAIAPDRMREELDPLLSELVELGVVRRDG